MTEISTRLVQKLICTQFPQWKALEIRPVLHGGHDNRTFHLGESMTVRLPSGPDYVAQVEKELKWLPFLAPRLSLPISCPVALGAPDGEYPFPWSVNRYIEGETAAKERISDMERFAAELASFLRELQSIDTRHAPAAGRHNFFRGASPAVYQEQVRQAMRERKNDLPVEKIRAIWARAIASEWNRPPVWIHGDVAPGNLLVKDGRLCGVIDFGIMGVGDPACDYAMAWTFFDEPARTCFLQGLDAGTVDRARGWALWKALITWDAPDADVSRNARDTLNAILDEHDKAIDEEAIE